jgi:nitrate reductase delta subunit
MFQSFRKSARERGAIAQVGDWTKARFNLSDQATVMVAEVNCQVPGCPPVETVIAFWTDPETRYRFKVFKPVAEVVEDDLPVSWLLPSLLDEDDLGCDCC